MSAEETKASTTATEQKAPPKEAAAAPEKQTNCLACAKPIKKLKRYYRDGKFYCSKKCWRAYIDKSKEAKQ